MDCDGWRHTRDEREMSHPPVAAADAHGASIQDERLGRLVETSGEASLLA
jgi:hypothetical protein